MEFKTNTSRAYLASHAVLREKVFLHWKEFYENIAKGPEEMKRYIANIWNEITDDKINEDFILIDTDRIVDENSFEITAGRCDGIQIFYVTFPEPECMMAEAKCVAIALLPDRPRYITMEVTRKDESRKYYVVGEWVVENNQFTHINYGEMEKDTTSAFAYVVENHILKNN